ncbi:MAG: hypothetical protein PUD16_02440 [bacterium]|nr:hypothetical protein [bacterium]
MAQHPCSVGANDNRKTIALSRMIFAFFWFFRNRKNTAEITSLEAEGAKKNLLTNGFWQVYNPQQFHTAKRCGSKVGRKRAAKRAGDGENPVRSFPLKNPSKSKPNTVRLSVGAASGWHVTAIGVCQNPLRSKSGGTTERRPSS